MLKYCTLIKINREIHENFHLEATIRTDGTRALVHKRVTHKVATISHARVNYTPRPEGLSHLFFPQLLYEINLSTKFKGTLSSKK